MFIVRDRETEALILRIAQDILRVVEKVGKFPFQMRVTWNLVRVRLLAVRENPGPLKAF